MVPPTYPCAVLCAPCSAAFICTNWSPCGAVSPFVTTLASADAADSHKVMAIVLLTRMGKTAPAMLAPLLDSRSPWLRRAVRSSMGTIYGLSVVETVSLASALRDLRLAGVRCVAAHPHTDQRTLAQADLRGDCCLVFGNEGHGVSPKVLAACDEAVLIPMANAVDSLNVGSAAAVFLYEVARQRGRG